MVEKGREEEEELEAGAEAEEVRGEWSAKNVFFFQGSVSSSGKEESVVF